MTNDHQKSRTSARRSVLLRTRRGHLRPRRPPVLAGAGAGEEVWRRRHAGRAEGRSAGLPLHRRRRHGQPRLCIRAEMGQGIRTSCGMVVADELEAELGARQGRCRRRATRRASATRTPTARAACATISSRFAASPRRPARCSSRKRPPAWGVPVTEVKAENNEHRPCRERPAPRLRRAGQGRGGAAGAAAATPWSARA